MNFLRLAALTLGVIPMVVTADPLPLKDLEKIEHYQRAIDASNKIDALMNEASRERTLACARAFGHTAMCKCLSDNLPFGFSFADYVAITTQTKEQNGYAKLDRQMKAAYDKVGPVRDECVRDTIK